MSTFTSDARDVARVGYIYLIHFDAPYKHAKHYLGFVETDVEARMVKHMIGVGSNLMRVVTSAGVAWRLAALWRGTRDDERRLKNTGASTRFCPRCKGCAHHWTPRVVVLVESHEHDDAQEDAP